jgi:hypothetical protein
MLTHSPKINFDHVGGF